MICKTCGRSVWRSCPHCQTAKEMLQRERSFLRTWSRGGIELRLREFKGVIHLEQFGDRWLSYCGVALFTFDSVLCPPTSRSRANRLPANACRNCRKILDELVEKAGVEGRHAL